MKKIWKEKRFVVLFSNFVKRFMFFLFDLISKWYYVMWPLLTHILYSCIQELDNDLRRSKEKFKDFERQDIKYREDLKHIKQKIKKLDDKLEKVWNNVQFVLSTCINLILSFITGFYKNWWLKKGVWRINKLDSEAWGEYSTIPKTSHRRGKNLGRDSREFKR